MASAALGRRFLLAASSRGGSSAGSESNRIRHDASAFDPGKRNTAVLSCTNSVSVAAPGIKESSSAA
jgi:hypothetical protein